MANFKKSLLLLLLSLSCFYSFSQTTTVYQSNSNTLTHNRGYFTVDSTLSAGYFVIPIKDTGINNKGNITINPSDSSVYFKVGNKWEIIVGGEVDFSDYLRKIDTTAFALYHPSNYGFIGNGIISGDTGIVVRGDAGGVHIDGGSSGVHIKSYVNSELDFVNTKYFNVSSKNDGNIKGRIGLDADGVQINGEAGRVNITGNIGGLDIESGFRSKVSFVSNEGFSVYTKNDSDAKGSLTLNSTGVNISGEAGQVLIDGGSGGITMKGYIRIQPYINTYPVEGSPLVFNSSDSTVKWGSMPTVPTPKIDTFTGSGYNYTLSQTPIAESVLMFVNGLETDYTISGNVVTILVNYTIDSGDKVKAKYEYNQ